MMLNIVICRHRSGYSTGCSKTGLCVLPLWCHDLPCSLHKYNLSCNFATAICSVAVGALESYAAGSGFKAQCSHYFCFIEIESHCNSFSQELGLGQHLGLAQNGWELLISLAN